MTRFKKMGFMDSNSTWRETRQNWPLAYPEGRRFRRLFAASLLPFTGLMKTSQRPIAQRLQPDWNVVSAKTRLSPLSIVTCEDFISPACGTLPDIYPAYTNWNRPPNPTTAAFPLV